MAKTMTFKQFKDAAAKTEFGVTDVNVRSAVNKILSGFNEDVAFQFDVEGVQFLLNVFENRQQNALYPLSKRSVLNYKQSFLRAAWTIADTPMNVRTKQVLTLPEVEK